MIRRCEPRDRDEIVAVANDAAKAYRGLLPRRFLATPYMSRDELDAEMSSVIFYGHEEAGELLGVMGIEPLEDLTLLRHAYVRTVHQGRGVGGQLLEHVESLTQTDWLMLGTWAGSRAVTFYLKHGFQFMASKELLLARYWPRVSQDQAANSVVMGKRLRFG